jgi:hypothetical protein
MAGRLIISLYVLVVCSAKQAIGNDIVYIYINRLSYEVTSPHVSLSIVEDMLDYSSQNINNGLGFRIVRTTLLS